MPQRPDGKAARVERVTFTRPAADRIAKAVRAVESNAGVSAGPAWEPPRDGISKFIRVCTFTGAWNINDSKTVTFKYQSVTPNTVAATNLFANITGVTATSTTKNCAIARDGTAWFLIAAQC